MDDACCLSAGSDGQRVRALCGYVLGNELVRVSVSVRVSVCVCVHLCV